MDGSYVGFQRGSAVCSLLLGFSQDLQRRWIARSSTLSFYTLTALGDWKSLKIMNKKLFYIVVIGALVWFFDVFAIKTYITAFWMTKNAYSYDVYPDKEHFLFGTKYLYSNKKCPKFYKKDVIVKDCFNCKDLDGDGMINSKDKCNSCGFIYHAHN